jgi:glycosyltransferase involved in cell wall biosynthesis
MDYSVCICTFNGESYIEYLLESIFSQQVIPKKIIISDDGSSDSTLEVILNFFNVIEYSHYLVVDGPCKGPMLNFFNAIKYSDQEYTFLVDQDDIWFDNRIEEYNKNINNDIPMLVYSDSLLFSDEIENGFGSFMKAQGLEHSILLDDSILFTNCVQGATICLNRKLLDYHIKISDKLNINHLVMHDWYFAILAHYCGEVKFIDIPLLYYRQHKSNYVGYISKKEQLSVLRAIKTSSDIALQLNSLMPVVNINRSDTLQSTGIFFNRILNIITLKTLHIRFVKKVMVSVFYVLRLFKIS